jgi:putative membrane protein
MFDHFEFMEWGGPMGLIWIVLLVLVLLLLGGLLRAGQGRDAESSARDILDRRYARGEIDRDEYQQRLEDLER